MFYISGASPLLSLMLNSTKAGVAVSLARPLFLLTSEGEKVILPLEERRILLIPSGIKQK
jgi:hypothetical protein